MKLMAAACLLLCGCAQSLPVLASGLDAAESLLKSQCPQRTAACERALDAYNVVNVTYNSAVLADALSEDSKALANSALEQLKVLWGALQALGAPNELAGPPK